MLWIYEVKASSEPELSLRTGQRLRLLRARSWLVNRLEATGNFLNEDREVGLSLLIPEQTSTRSRSYGLRAPAESSPRDPDDSSNNIEFIEIPVLD